MRADGRENALGGTVALPRRTLAGSAGAKALERTATWSLRYRLENAAIVAGALVPYPLAGVDGAIAAVALGAAAALALGLASDARGVLGGPPRLRERRAAAMFAGVAVTVAATFGALRDAQVREHATARA